MPSQGASHQVHTAKMCPAVQAHHFRCLAVAIADARGKLISSQSSKASPLASGFTPTDVQKAYNLTGLSSSGRTVAIVDAFGYPGLESDLATYRSTNGLPACTQANGCLKIMGQTGGAPPNNSDAGWDIEQALDVD